MTDSREIPTPRLETDISRIRNRSAKHYEATFGVNISEVYVYTEV